MVCNDLPLFMLKIETTTRGTNSMSLPVFRRDHLRCNLGIISGLGILCGRGSFAALYNSLYGGQLTIGPVALEGEGSHCFNITQLVEQKRQ